MLRERLNNKLKRYGYLFDKIVDKENLILAHKNASKGKQKYWEVKMINEDVDKYIDKLHDMLVSRSYYCSPYQSFKKIHRGKEREIFKIAYFPDRITQHAILQIVEPIWKASLITDTYQSIKGRGVHKCKEKIEKIVQQDGIQYCLQLDIKKYYPSIQNNLLKEVMRYKIKCPDTLELLDRIIDGHDGVPIGNYISQYMGNVFLNKLDHYIKEELRVKHYFRYCDDLLLLSNSKEGLWRFKEVIENWLNAHGLELKDSYRVFKITELNPVDALGYLIYPSRTRLRGNIAEGVKKSLHECDELALPSFLGWAMHADARPLIDNNVKKRKSNETYAATGQ